MAGYDDYQTEEEYIAASKRRVTMADTKELVVRLRAKARHEAGQIEFVSSRQLDRNIFAEAADALERLERELAENIAARNDFAKDWDAAHNRAEAAESELTTLRTRVAKMEGVLRQVVHACFHYTGEDQDDLVNDAYDNAASLLSQEEQQP